MDESTNRWMLWGVGLLVLLVLAFVAYRLVEPNRRAEAKAQHVANLIATGDELFVQNCAACHGQNATGGIGPALNSKQFLGSVSDEQIRSLVSVGIPGTQMSAYLQDFNGPFTLEQINALSSYLRSLEKGAPDRPNWREPLAAPSATGGGTTTTVGAAGPDGKAIYTAKCAACHGANLEGGVGKALDANSPAAGDPDEELLGTIENGVAGTAMPAWSGSPMRRSGRSWTTSDPSRTAESARVCLPLRGMWARRGTSRSDGDVFDPTRFLPICVGGSKDLRRCWPHKPVLRDRFRPAKGRNP
ncbi:MAG: c-type cytochrome [Actinobacteria bacterium]|nr:c-type cytochrome [Actinomycetota bacterium]